MRSIRFPRRARAGLIALVLVLVTAASIGCAESARNDPTALRQGYRSLDNLIAICRSTATEMRDAMVGQYWTEARQYGENLMVYAGDLRAFAPSDRDFTDVERFDRTVAQLESRITAADHYARLHKVVLGEQSIMDVLSLIEVLDTYTDAPGRYDGDHYRGRPSSASTGTTTGP